MISSDNEAAYQVNVSMKNAPKNAPMISSAPLAPVKTQVAITDDMARAAYGENYQQMKIPGVIELDWSIFTSIYF